MTPDNPLFATNVDLGNAPQQFNKLEQLFAKQERAINSFVDAQAKMDQNSDRLATTLESLVQNLVNLSTPLETAKRLHAETAEAAEKSAKKQEAAAQRLIAKELRLEEAATRRADRQRQQASQAATQANNEIAGQAVGAGLREHFVPKDINLSATQLASVEAPIRSIVQRVQSGTVSINELAKVVTQFAVTGTTDFANLDATTIRFFRSLTRASENLSKFGQQDHILTLQQRIEVATTTAQRFQRLFSQPLSAAGLGTAEIDSMIAKLAILVREAGLSQDRIRTLFNATQVQGTVPSIAGDLSKPEAQIIKLMQRIQEMNRAAQDGAAASAKKQQDYAAAIAATQPVIARITQELSKQFGAISSPQQFAALQNATNQLSKDLATGKLNAEQLLNVLRQLQGSGFGGGKGGPPSVLLPGQGGEEQSRLLRLIGIFNQVEDAGTKAGKHILLSWESVTRLFQVQILHQVIGQFISELRRSVDEASKFQIRISEIRTISQQNQLTTAQWASGLRDLSDAFGLPLLDVTKAAYDAISNQVTRGAQTFEFLRTTLEFSRISVSSAADAQNLLSSAIKSFGEQNLTAQKAAEVLFKTIDLGRVTASEMANTFGRVAQLASQAGVTIEQLGAAIATLTVRGVRYSEAYTLINNVLVSAIKPSEAMTEVLRKYGVTTGEAAIRTFGFAGFLRILQSELNSGGLSKLAEIEQNIRSIRGALGLVSGDAFAEFEQNLQSITNGAEQFRRAGDIIRESPAFKLEQEMNKLRNIFAIDFGQEMIRTVLELTAPFGGFAVTVKGIVDLIKELIGAVKNVIEPFALLAGAINSITFGLLTTGLSGLLKVLVAYATVTLAAQAATYLWTTALALAAGSTATLTTRLSLLIAGMNSYVLVATAVVALFLNARAASDQLAASLDAQSEAIQRNREQLEQQRIERDRQNTVDTFTRANEQTFRNLNLVVAAGTQQLTGFLDALRNVNRVGVRELQLQAEAVFSNLAEKAKDIEAYVKSILSDLENSTKRIIALTERDRARAAQQRIDSATPRDQPRLVQEELALLRNRIQQTQQAPLEQVITVRYRVPGFRELGELTAPIRVLQAELNRLTQAGQGQSAAAIAIRNELAKTPLITPEVLEQSRKAYDEIDKMLEKYIKQTEAAIQQQEKLITSLTARAELRSFEQSLRGKNENERFNLTIQRTDQLQREAITLFNTGNLEEARKKFDEINTILESISKQIAAAIEQQQKLITSLKARTELRGFERSLEGKSALEQTRLSLERTDRLKEEAITLFNNGDLEESRKKFEEIDRLLEKIFDRQKSFDQKAAKLGVFFSTPLGGGDIDQRLNANDATRLALEEGRLATLQQQQRDVDARLSRNDSTRLGLEQGRLGDLRQQHATLSEQQRRNTADSIAFEQRYQAQQQERYRQAIEAQTRLNELIRIGQELATGQNALNTALTGATTRQGTAQTDVRSNLDAMAAMLRTVRETNVATAGSGFIDDARAIRMRSQITGLTDDLERLLARIRLNPNDQDALDQYRQKLAELTQLRRDFAQIGGFQTDATRLRQDEQILNMGNQQLRQLNQLIDARNRLNAANQDIDTAQRGRQDIDNRVNALRNDPAVQAALAAANLLNNAQQPILNFTQRLNQQVQTLSDAMDRLIEVIRRPALGVNPGPDGVGPVRRNLGGPIGTDTQLAWFSPDEFIMNAESSRRFAPQIRAMNMGFQPTYNSNTSNTGSTTNVGDVHVTYVHQGKSSPEEVRQFAQLLRREMRRGTI